MSETKPDALGQWSIRAQDEIGGKPLAKLNWTLSEEIPMKPVHTSGDISDLKHLGTMPGLWPFVRGPRATMYANRPWTIRQYGGFSDAERTNAFFRENLAAGQTGLSIAFDLPTLRGYDSDHPHVIGDVGMAGVSIDSVEDMKLLFDGIDLGCISVSMTMNGAVLPVLATYIVAAEEQGVTSENLRGTIQNDILKEFMVRNTYIYPPAPSMRIAGDVITFTSKRMPRFNPISISGYHMQEAGATAVQELSFTLANGLEYVRAGLARGLSIDEFAPRLSFFFGVGMDFFTEIAKMRAARLLWAELLAQYHPVDPASSALRFHTQTSGVSLTEQDPYNNIVRTTIEALAAVLGGTQSLHTNAYDEALGLPTPLSARIARHTQLIIRDETGITRTIDPLGGSYFIESLTARLADAARTLIGEVESLGGMTKAIELGVPKLRIEAAAARRQARIDCGEDVVVGVNRFTNPAPERPPVFAVDCAEVRERQIARLSRLREMRDQQACTSALEALSQGAATSDANLLELTIEAIRRRATIGEVSDALERVFTRHRAVIRSVAGVYGGAAAGNELFAQVRQETEEFLTLHGRRPRMYVAKLGQDGHDRGAKVIATGFADVGFDIDIGPLFQTPEEAVRHAIDNDVHVIGISSQAAAHRVLVPLLMLELRRRRCEHMLVVCGGVIPPQDYNFLEATGVAAVYGPGTSIATAASNVLKLILRALESRPAVA
jgi:methylmalonyl-CoA mutase